MIEEYRCYFISRDRTGRTLANVPAGDPLAAVEAALRRFPKIAYATIEVFLRSDRVLIWKHPTAATERAA
jgi:hypothetical protein